MGKLLTLFIFGFIGLLLRYIILGKFELDQLIILLLFPIGSLFIYFVMKWQYNKDRYFEPDSDGKFFVTRIGDRTSTTIKQMFKEGKHIGTYHRIYDRWWKHVIADIMDSPGLWYLNLSFSLSNGDVIIFKREDETKLIGNNEWTIYRNNEEIGTVSTDFSFKNKRKLRESLYLHYEGNTYHFKSSSIKSKTEISIDNLRIATGQRLSGPVYELMISNSDEKEAELLFMVYILFNYQFGQ